MSNKIGSIVVNLVDTAIDMIFIFMQICHLTKPTQKTTRNLFLKLQTGRPRTQHFEDTLNS